MSEVTNRNEVRAITAAGGWTIVYGDLINEIDVIELVISVPTGTVAGWVSSQVDAQVKKFNQSLATVSDDVVKEATQYLKGLLQNKTSGERDINGLGVKAGIVTYHRKLKTPLGSVPLADNYQPYIGIRITKPLPPKGEPTSIQIPPGVQPTAPPNPAHDGLDRRLWYRIKNPAKPGMAIDVVNDGNQQQDGQVQMAAEGNFSGQHWQLRPSRTDPGAYNLCNMWLGANKCLDVYGNDKTKPHVATAGNYSGQQWRVEEQGYGTWKLSNSYSGPLVLLADASGGGVSLKDAQVSSPAMWTLQPIKSITETGF
ncbi:carbohydrate-binding module family 13 protein [Trichoderma citrinoviride]|uniref:Carbohydrate-binding module family 13 protein n=1 Tax=Trichoderma citrinoviride TaxID=58853 RepID=A0A2T4B643_9HYPO|nr:carbohydrate-binding module family 13 protein [Trichoderma citrinoviride]PTB64794.1 carbohydrate-binding module family 13 protein [Trichoderma citrinoviride]